VWASGRHGDARAAGLVTPGDLGGRFVRQAWATPRDGCGHAFPQPCRKLVRARALGAGAGELSRGRTWRGDDRVRSRSHWNPNEPEQGGQPNEPECGCETKRTRTQRRGKGTRAQRRPNPTAVKIERTRAQGKAKGTRASWKSERTQAYVRFQWFRLRARTARRPRPLVASPPALPRLPCQSGR
jgi:hypothetical protein